MNKPTLQFRSFISALALVLTLANPLATLAIEPPTAPTAPTAPSSPVAPTAPTPPAAPEATIPVPPEAPTAPTAPTMAAPSPTVATVRERLPRPVLVESNPQETSSEAQGGDQINSNDNQGENSNGGNVGDTTINTGDGNATLLANNTTNNNFSSTPICNFGCNSSEASVINSDNGTDSTNTATNDTTNATDFNQNNTLNINNDFGVNVTTGENTSDKNVGATSISTGDADVVVTAVNLGNNNGINTSYQEFNVYDNQVGDINFNFADPMYSGDMLLGGNTAANTSNGADSTNTASNTTTNTIDIGQNNLADVSSDIYIVAETGANSASKNVGDSSIETGDANVVANVINFLNNNIVAGAEFLIGVVNIYGTLEGDIILPHDVENASCLNCAGGDTLALNTGNGSGSTNTASTDVTNTTNINQTNDGNILNNLTINATTGDNSTSRNTGGDNSITTGDVTVSADTINVMNNNLVGTGDEVWWLVLVNNMGTWTGKITGSPDGATTAGSGLEFAVAPDGSIVALNSGNGADSTNTATNSTSNTTTVDQSNQANLVNNLTINANTGGNDASRNTGGNSTITTGDVNVAANIVNFINNNFVGKKFMIAVVNIFGNFLGNIIPPDQPLPLTTNVSMQGALAGSQEASNPSNPVISSNPSSISQSTGSGGGISGSTTNNPNSNSNLTSAGNSGTGSNTQVLGALTNKTLVKDLVSTVPLEEALAQGFTLNYVILAGALSVLILLTLTGRLLSKGGKI